MPLDKSRLAEFLEAIDKELDGMITLVAAGGTALTLLDVKPSTIDVDFTGPADSIRKLNAAVERLQPGSGLTAGQTEQYSARRSLKTIYRRASEPKRSSSTSN